MAAQPTSFAIDFFVPGSRFKGSRSISSDVAIYACAAFISESSGTVRFSLNQLAPLSSLPKRSPFCCAAYMQSALTGSKAKLSTKLRFACDTAQSIFFQDLAAVGGLNQKRFGAAVAPAPLPWLAVGQRGIEHVVLFWMNRQRHGVFFLELRRHRRPVVAGIVAEIERTPRRFAGAAIVAAGGDDRFCLVSSGWSTMVCTSQSRFLFKSSQFLPPSVVLSM